ncbi:MAG TPA: membrane protein insertase YidC, partial [Nitrosomonas sp.]|nr:membrane protein insertase YidC [Nitrosomonas sp.]
METKKLVLIFIFITSLLFIWEGWMRERERLDNLANGTLVTDNNSVSQQGPDSPPIPGDALVSSQSNQDRASGIDAASASTGTPRNLPTGEQIKVITDMVIAEIDTAGGDVRKLELLKHPSRENKEIPYALLHSDATQTSVAQSGLIGEGFPTHKTQYTLETKVREYSLEADQDKIEVRLVAPRENEVQVTKIYTFNRGSYVIDVRFEIDNQSEEIVRPFAYFQMLRDSNPPAGATMMIPTYLGAAIYTEDEKFQKIQFSDLDKNKADYPRNADNGWIAMLEHYFLSAWLPPQKAPREYFAKRQNDNLYTAGV